MAAKRETYRLTIEAQPHATVPAQVRLRSVLKRLLRTFGFRAVKVEEVKHGQEETSNASHS